MYKVNKAQCIVHCTNSRLVNMVEYFVSRSFLKQRSVFSLYRKEYAHGSKKTPRIHARKENYEC